jgi:hypothetical protein
MNTTHINTLLVLAERARQAGLIQFEEMPAVVEAVKSGRDTIQAAQAQQSTPAAAASDAAPERAKGSKAV